MHLPPSLPVLVAGLFLAGCQSGPSSPPEPPGAQPEERVASSRVEAPDPSILPRPYTAEQIRDAWVPGLTLVMRRKSPEGESLERWTVVEADADGADISAVAVDGDGNVAGEPRVQRAEWWQLRDHATFAVQHSDRKAVTRETPLGRLDGWLYTVRDDADGTLTELFFASALPGPPVEVRIVRAGELVLELTQLEHQPPPKPRN